MGDAQCGKIREAIGLLSFEGSLFPGNVTEAAILMIRFGWYAETGRRKIYTYSRELTMRSLRTRCL